MNLIKPSEHKRKLYWILSILIWSSIWWSSGHENEKWAWHAGVKNVGFLYIKPRATRIQDNQKCVHKNNPIRSGVSNAKRNKKMNMILEALH